MSEELWKRARKLPVVVEYREPNPQTGCLHEWIGTMEGVGKATPGKSYVIRGIKGELYPIDKTIFAETYKVLDEGEQPRCLQGLGNENDRYWIADALGDCLKCSVEKCPVKDLLMQWRMQPL